MFSQVISKGSNRLECLCNIFVYLQIYGFVAQGRLTEVVDLLSFHPYKEQGKFDVSNYNSWKGIDFIAFLIVIAYI